MESKDRLIYANEVIEEIDDIIGNINFSSPYQNDIHLIVEGLERARDCVLDARTVDAVPVEDIKLHHILIDNEGIPEVKLQFGDRFLTLRREGDPVDLVPVVYGQWIDKPVGMFEIPVPNCSFCGSRAPIEELYHEHGGRYTTSKLTNFCPNCGAKMR